MQGSNADNTPTAYALESFPRDYEGYIFDLDGTLADSMPIHFRSWRQAFVEHGAKFDFTWQLFYQYAGAGGLDTIVSLGERHGQELPAEAIMALQHDLLIAGLPTVEPIAQVVAIAQQLKAAGAAVCVASGGERDHVLDTLRVIGLENFFPVVVTKDDVVNSKPHPETFLLAAERLGVNPRRCIVFEDSLLGVQAATSAHMDYVYLAPDMHRF